MADNDGPEPDFEVPVGMFQDLEDLKAKMAALEAQVKTLTEGGAAETGEALERTRKTPAGTTPRTATRARRSGSTRRSSCCWTRPSTTMSCAP